MDNQLVNNWLSDSEKDVKNSVHFASYTDKFYEVFPYYLTIGMSYEQFWDGDPALTIYYRKADKIRMERLNQKLWLQGLYIYEALCDVSPILHAFAKKGAKPIDYTKYPYPLDNATARQIQDNKERETMKKGKRFLEAFMVKNNNKYFESKSPLTNKKEGQKNGGNN